MSIIFDDGTGMNTKQSKKDRKRAEELRGRLAELAASQESALDEMDRIQAELAAIGESSSQGEGPAVNMVGEDEDGDAERDRVRADLDELKQSLDASEDRYRRVLADFSNFQRRASENERRAREAGKAGVLEQMVAVLDTFDLAMRMNPETTSPQAMLQGVQMIKGEMLRLLSSQGLASIDPGRGEEFDPHRHEAVQQAETEDVPPGCIVEVHQSGYALGERVLRPAKVSVRSGAEAGQAAEQEAAGDAGQADAGGEDPGSAGDSISTDEHNSVDDGDTDAS